MNEKDVQYFFKVLAKELSESVKIILTGAAAASLWGGVRPSQDVDFAIQMARKNPRLWETIEAAIQRTVRLTGVAANYAEDIDRWGMISLLDYKKHTHLYARYGSLRVHLLDPMYWSIGKLTRCLDSDVEDVTSVFKKQRPQLTKTIRLWGRAFRSSPKSTRSFAFRKNVEDFLKRHGPSIWGNRFDYEKAKIEFWKEARIEIPNSGI